MVANSLQELKYNVIEAYNGEEGLEKAEKIIPDLIITDLRMPKMSGYEMIEKIHLNPKLNNTKILVITSSEDLNVSKVWN